MRELRDYQREAVAHLQQGWATGLTRIPMVLATGLGKTEIFTDPSLLDPFLGAGKRVLILAHTDELIEQAAKKARRNNPGRRVGIVKAEQNECAAQIIVSSRQTLQSARRRIALRNIGLIIIDEAHHAIRSNTYGKILEHFGCFGEDQPHFASLDSGPAPLVAGFTATLARGDDEKLSTVWEQPEGGLFSRDILFGIRRGFLLDVTGKRVIVPDLDMSRVEVSGGDYQDGALGEEMERVFAPEIVAKRYKEEAGARKGIAFWPLVSVAEHGAEAFNAQGVRSETIHGKLGRSERRGILQRLHTGETQVVHGVGVLTEGFDEPTVDVVVIGRPTRSAPLYQQMVGRVLRPDLTIPASEREKALVLDVVGAGATHDLRSLIDLAPPRPAREKDESESESLDDLSLLELEQLWEQQEDERAAASGREFEGAENYSGETAVVEFDPLGREKLWGQTPDGTYFITAGSAGYVFLAESVSGDPATYDVVLCSKLSYPRDGVRPWVRATEHVALSMDLALAEAEEVAERIGGRGSKTMVNKKARWRKNEPMEWQKRKAEGLGVWKDGMNKGECAEAIDARLAAIRIDPLARAVKAIIEREIKQESQETK